MASYVFSQGLFQPVPFRQKYTGKGWMETLNGYDHITIYLYSYFYGFLYTYWFHLHAGQLKNNQLIVLNADKSK